jgi:Holliday junction resolvase-like predicted endonuclease
MNEKLLLTIIKHATLNSVNTNTISDETGIPINTVIRNINNLVEDKLLTISHEIVESSFDQRIQLAIYGIKEGIDIEKICTALGWREFEDLAILILEYNGFKTLKHYRFKSLVRRYEIDILAYRNSVILSIDCKRWKRSWQKAATRRIIHAQVERTKALIQSFSSLTNFFKITNLINIGFIPLIVTLSETPYKIYEKVPAVPIFHFQNFLDEMNIHIDRLMTLRDFNQ